MITASGIVSRTRNATFKSGKNVTFLEAIIEQPDRTEVLEILLADGMNPGDFVKGARFEMAVSFYAKDNRLYCSAVRNQPEKFPFISVE